MTGRLVEVKRFAIHDGPGIRTTLFLKGCALACRWCHNPETISPRPEIGQVARKCIACQRCAVACPQGVHRFLDGTHEMDRGRCIACGACVAACLPGALEFYGREWSVEEAVAAVVEDRTFYEQSGGGCTFSGGEPLLQAEFCAAVAGGLREEGISCAIDTCGAVPGTKFATVLPQVDLFLYDLKHMDDARHREGTGASNRLVLENLRRLAEAGKDYEIRLPLIPDFNDGAENLRATGEFLRSLARPGAVRLLSYHSYARSKFTAIGRPDTMPAVPAPDAAALARAAGILRETGVAVL
jgi:pyruvate formate lyase activating enzyme